MKAIFALFILGFFGLIFWFVIVVPFVGWHYETARGEHTGYVTATQTTGLFFKTHSAYLKTDTQSSQEDEYCVVGDDVMAKLKTAQTSKEKITVEYVDWFAKGVSYCGAELSGVITGVK
jgi:hypothetical protein